MVSYALRSNCAAGVWPLWHPTQYFATKGFTVCSNCRSSAGEAAFAAGSAAKTKMIGQPRWYTKKLIVYPSTYDTRFKPKVTAPHCPIVGQVANLRPIVNRPSGITTNARTRSPPLWGGQSWLQPALSNPRGG